MTAPATKDTKVDSDVLLDVQGLAVAYRNAQGDEVRLVDDVTFTLKRGETLGLAGESGLRQDHHGALVAGPAAHQPLPSSRAGDAQLRSRGHAPRAPDRPRLPRSPLAQRVDRVPRCDERARSGDARVEADRRSAPSARPRHRRHRRARAHQRAVRVRRDESEPGDPVPPRVLRRYAPARHDRARARVRAGADHRRRADDGARRDDAGPDPGAAGVPSRRVRARDDPHHPRPVGPRRNVRSGRDHVRRPVRRDRLGRGALPHATAPVHAPAPWGIPGDRRPARARTADPRRPARRVGVAARMPLRASLPHAGGSLRRRRTGARAARRRPCRTMPVRAVGTGCARSTRRKDSPTQDPRRATNRAGRETTHPPGPRSPAAWRCPCRTKRREIPNEHHGRRGRDSSAPDLRGQEPPRPVRGSGTQGNEEGRPRVGRDRPDLEPRRGAGCRR